MRREEPGRVRPEVAWNSPSGSTGVLKYLSCMCHAPSSCPVSPSSAFLHRLSLSAVFPHFRYSSSFFYRLQLFALLPQLSAQVYRTVAAIAGSPIRSQSTGCTSAQLVRLMDEDGSGACMSAWNFTVGTFFFASGRRWIFSGIVVTIRGGQDGWCGIAGRFEL